MNGVTSASQQAGSSSGVGEHVALGNPNIYDPAPQTEQDLVSGTTTSTELRPDVADPPYGEPHQGATVISPTANGVLTTPTSAHARPDVLTTPGAPATVRVQEFFSAESTVSTHEDRNVRWMARFTELMRAAATRGASSWDRVMDNLGMQPGPPATSNPGNESLFRTHSRSSYEFLPAGGVAAKLHEEHATSYFVDIRFGSAATFQPDSGGTATTIPERTPSTIWTAVRGWL